MFNNNNNTTGKSNAGWVKYALTALAGAVAVPVLKSGIAKKAYTYITAGAFIARDSIMEGVEKVQATALDVSVDANEIKEQYYAKRDGQIEVEICDAEEVQEEA